MRRGCLLATALLLAALPVGALLPDSSSDSGSVYRGRHQRTFVLDEPFLQKAKAGPVTIYLWLPLVVPKIWVALAPQYVDIELRRPGGQAPNLVEVARSSGLVFAADFSGSDGTPWMPLAENPGPRFRLAPEGEPGGRVLRGAYRLTVAPANPGPWELTVNSDVVLDGVVVGWSLADLGRWVDTTF